MKKIKAWLHGMMEAAEKKRTRQRGMELYHRFQISERYGYLFLLVDGVAVKRFEKTCDTTEYIADEIARARHAALYYEGMGYEVKIADDWTREN